MTEEPLHLCRCPAVHNEQPGGAGVSEVVWMYVADVGFGHDPVPGPTTYTADLIAELEHELDVVEWTRSQEREAGQDE